MFYLFSSPDGSVSCLSYLTFAFSFTPFPLSWLFTFCKEKLEFCKEKAPEPIPLYIQQIWQDDAVRRQRFNDTITDWHYSHSRLSALRRTPECRLSRNRHRPQLPHPCLIIRILFLTKTNKTLAVTQCHEIVKRNHFSSDDTSVSKESILSGGWKERTEQYA